MDILLALLAILAVVVAAACCAARRPPTQSSPAALERARCAAIAEMHAAPHIAAEIRKGPASANEGVPS